MNLFEHTQCYKNILDLVDNEELTDEDFEKALVTVEDSLYVKVENLAKVIQEIKGNSELCKNEIKRLQNRIKHNENAINRLNNYLMMNMNICEIKKVKGKSLTVLLKNNPASVEVEDVALIPKEFLKEKIEVLPDKTKIKDYLKLGNTVTGAKLIKKQSISIR